MSTTDSRNLDKDRQASNRRRFMGRHRKAIKRQVDNQIYGKKLKDVAEDDKVTIRPDEEPSFNYDINSDKTIIIPGNDKYYKGDTIAKPPSGGDGRGGASGDGEGTDEFEFYLSKEELIDIYFSDMELPNLVKETLKTEIKYSMRTGGYSKDGIPPRLAIKKTFENAIARRIANKKSGHKSPFLDDIDLRYIRKYRVPEPYTKAVMFCMMDVSGSMTEHHKRLGKRFYVLLYLFLTKFYKDIEVVFIRYHSFAKEVTEEEFFYGKDTGGTCVSSAQKLVQKIINERFPISDYNLYLAHVSDGDIFSNEIKEIKKYTKELSEVMQYIAYLEVSDPSWGDKYDESSVCLFNLYRDLELKDKIGITKAEQEVDIYPALRGLFRKKGLE